MVVVVTVIKGVVQH